MSVNLLAHTFRYYLAVIQRLDAEGEKLELVAAAGELAERSPNFLLPSQPVDSGVNGRVARTASPALVTDTRRDPDYVGSGTEADPGSELAVSILVGEEVWGVLSLEQLSTGAFDGDDLVLSELVAGQIGAAVHRVQLVSELEEATLSTLGALTAALELSDPYTAGHADEVACLCEAVARRLGLDAHEQQVIRRAGALHDIGKIGVPSEILRKPGRLTEAEMVELQQHADIGARLLERIPFFAEVHPLVRSAHERWDGGGYPDGLAGESIPLGARIIGACDAWHAMISDRPYRPALPADRARRELEARAGTQFDPDAVVALLEILG